MGSRRDKTGYGCNEADAYEANVVDTAKARRVEKIRKAIKRRIEGHEGECCQRARDREALRWSRYLIQKGWPGHAAHIADVVAKRRKRRKR